jgi:DNA-binding MarR family transcriptional regulator
MFLLGVSVSITLSAQKKGGEKPRLVFRITATTVGFHCYPNKQKQPCLGARRNDTAYEWCHNPLPKGSEPSMARSQNSTNPPENTTPEERIERVDELLSELQRRAFRLASIVARESSLTVQQFLALAYLTDRGGRAVNDLRNALGIAQSTASELVTRLERGGFVLKERDPRDARSLRVELTPKGREAVRKRRRAAKEYYKTVFAEISDANQNAMIVSLESLLETLPGAEPEEEETPA